MALNYKDLQDMVLNILDVDDSSTRNDVKKFLNIAARDVWNAYPWPERVEVERFVNTRPTYTTGTVTLTNGSKAVVGVGTTWSTNVYPGFKIATSHTAPWYEVDSVTDNTNLVLRETYQDTTVSGNGYVAYEDVLRLSPEVEQLTGAWVHRSDQRHRLDQVTEQVIEAPRGYTSTANFPTAITIQGRDEHDSVLVRLDVAPDAAYRVEYAFLRSYAEMVEEGDESVIPEKRRDLIVHKTLYYIYLRDHFQKAMAMLQVFNRELRRHWRSEGSYQSGRLGRLSRRAGPYGPISRINMNDITFNS